MRDPKLVTLAEYSYMTAMAQGYVQYMQGDLPGSELKKQTNPYLEESKDWEAWNEGQQRACRVAQDSEEG